MLERLLIVQMVSSTGLYTLLDYTFQCDLIDHSSNGLWLLIEVDKFNT